MRTFPILLCAAMVATPAVARDRQPLDLPAGTLGDAVAALAAQTSLSVRIESDTLWNRPVGSLRGQMSAREALDRLLKGSGAKAVRLGSNGWSIRQMQPSPRRAAPPPRPASPAVASPPPAPAPIIVTASKRDTMLTRFPGTVNLIDGTDLTFGGAQGTDGLIARIASLSSTHLGSGRNKLFIRGIADSSFTGPTQSTVGQYFGDLRLSYNAPDPDLRLYDIGSVEILEGPQGTLYGAGSLGGIIRIVPKTPDLERTGAELSGGLSATQHGTPGADIGGTINLPLMRERIGLRLTAYAVTEGGYIDDIGRDRNDINRTHVEGGRATIRVDGGNGWTIDIGGILQNNHGADNQYADPALPPLTRSGTIGGGFDARYRMASLLVEKRWNTIELHSSTAYVRQKLDERYDATIPDGPPQIFRQNNDTRFFTTENRLSYAAENGLSWVAGASYVHNSTTLGRAFGAPDMPLPVTGVTNKVSEATVYGETTVEPIPALALTSGLRYSRTILNGGGEDVSPAFIMAGRTITAKRTEERLLPSFAVLAEPLSGTTLYARYQQGFRPGGLAIEGPFVRRFRNDRVRTLEAGIRHLPSNGGGVALSLSIAHSQWQDIQADFIDSAGLPSTENIGDGRIWSVSGTGRWQASERLSIEASAAMNDSKVTQPSEALLRAFAFQDVAQVPNVANISWRTGFDYHAPVLNDKAELHLNGWLRYVGKSRLGIGPVLGEQQGDYLDSGFTARIGTPAFGIALSLTNLDDEVGNRFALGTPLGATFGHQVTPLRPRTIRVGIDTAF